MNNLIPVTNNTKNAIPVGSSYVMPGETKHFPEHQVPPHLRPVEQAEPEQKKEQPLLADLKLSIPKITEKLTVYSDEQLAELKAGEESASKSRTGLLAAFAEEELRRAKEKVDDENPDTTGDEDNPGTDQTGGDGGNTPESTET